MSSKIFISYSRNDETFARRLEKSLSKLGAEIWIDVNDIRTGQNWSSAIQEGLDLCEMLLLIISPDSMDSKNVQAEWQYFYDQNKPIIPILFKPAKPHFQLIRIQHIDFHKLKYEIAMEKLRTELRSKGIILKETLSTFDENVAKETPNSLDMESSGAFDENVAKETPNSLNDVDFRAVKELLESKPDPRVVLDFVLNESEFLPETIRVLMLHHKLVFAVTIKQALEKTGEFDVRPFTQLNAACKFLQDNPQDIALVDFTIPGSSGVDIVRELRSIQPKLSIIATSPQSEIDIQTLNLQGSMASSFDVYEVALLIKKICSSTSLKLLKDIDDLLSKSSRPLPSWDTKVRNEAPRAIFTVERSKDKTLLGFQFKVQSLGEITDYLWHFGDSVGSSERNPFHVYPSPGIYTVTLKVTGPGGSHDMRMQITVR